MPAAPRPRRLPPARLVGAQVVVAASAGAGGQLVPDGRQPRRGSGRPAPSHKPAGQLRRLKKSPRTPLTRKRTGKAKHAHVFSRRKRCPSQGVGPSVAHHRLPLKAPAPKSPARSQPLLSAPLETCGAVLCAQRAASGAQRLAAARKAPSATPTQRKPRRAAAPPPSRPRRRPRSPKRCDEPGVPNLRLRVAAAGAAAVLDVEGALPTPAADGVRLVVPLALRRGPLRHGSPPRGALRAHTTGRSGGSCREL